MFSEHQLISDAQLSVITRNRAKIIEKLDTSGIFLDALVETKIVSAEFNSELLSIRTDADRNTLLLDYMMKRSQRKLNDFIEVLQKENQTHVSELFRTKGKTLIITQICYTFFIDN